MLNYRGRLEDDLCKGTCYLICKRHETEGIMCYTVWPNSPVKCIEKSRVVVEVKHWKKGGQIPKKLMGKDFIRTSISLVCIVIDGTNRKCQVGQWRKWSREENDMIIIQIFHQVPWEYYHPDTETMVSRIVCVEAHVYVHFKWQLSIYKQCLGHNLQF